MKRGIRQVQFMNQIKIARLILGPVETNCYFALNEAAKELVVIDPADDALQIQRMIDRLQAEPAAVFLTHGHFDHIGAASEIRDRYKVPVFAMRMEKELLGSGNLNLSAHYGVPVTLSADRWLEDGDELSFAGFTWQALHTPGHTPGGCCFYIAQQGVLFSGDTLFRGSIGRTDFPQGSIRQLLDSLQTKLMILPEDTIVYPGHGEASTIGFEKKYNPYCEM